MIFYDLILWRCTRVLFQLSQVSVKKIMLKFKKNLASVKNFIHFKLHFHHMLNFLFFKSFCAKDRKDSESIIVYRRVGKILCRKIYRFLLKFMLASTHTWFNKIRKLWKWKRIIEDDSL
jgi:hypothetical protein